MIKFLNIKLTVTILILALGIVSISIFSFFSYQNTKVSLEKEYFKEAELVLKHTILYFDRLFDRTENTIQLICKNEMVLKSIANNDSNNILSLVGMIGEMLDDYKKLQIGMEDESTYIIPITHIPKSYNPKQQHWYIQAKRFSDKIIWTEPYLDYMTQDIIITAAKAIKNSKGEIMGVVAADFNVSDISNLISKSKIGEMGYVLLLSNDGTIVANRDDYMIGEKVFGEDFKHIIKKQNNEKIEYSIKGNKYHINHDVLERNGMVVITAISKKEINNNLKRASFPGLLIGIISLMIFGVIAYFLVLLAISPFEKLMNLMRQAEEGNYNIRAEITGFREIDSVIKSFNRMINGIRERDLKLISYNDELAFTEEKLREKYEEIKKSKKILELREQKIKHLAYFDTLTNLSNRERIIRCLKDAIEQSERHNHLGCVVFIDLDNFKKINDTMGHSIGDKVLIEIAKKLNVQGEHEKVVARLGGDEFFITYNNINSVNTIHEICSNIIDTINQPLVIDSKTFNVSSSIGVAVFPDHGISVDELMKKADMAMYKSKENGKNGYRIFDESIEEELMAKVKIENEIIKALKENEFYLYYQPQYNLFNGEIYGMEALLRWKSPELGQVSPSKFIKVAEETGLIIPLEQWVIKQACLFARKISNKYDETIKVSINISAVQIMQNNFVNNLIKTIKDSHVNPRCIEIEVTETVMIDLLNSQKQKLEQLKNFGIGIHLDDFGSGYSSLSYLQSLPIDYVKVDKKFIDSMLNSEKDSKITATIVELVHNIGLKVIAEGVETKEQFDKLSDFKCDIVQGYYMNKPMSEEKAADLLKLDIC
ncbi:MAG: EAL domain-containing protein [Clostridia bacterium]|nr:EAL domain-containing protein [Clostridia bacterium]